MCAYLLVEIEVSSIILTSFGEGGDFTPPDVLLSKETSLQRIQSSEDVPFYFLNWSICSKQKSFGKKTLIYFFICLALFIVQNLEPIKSYEDVPFWGQK